MATNRKFSSKAKPRKKKNDGAPGWVGPAAVGGGLLVLGIGLFSRRGSAKGDNGANGDGSQADGSDNNGANGDGAQPSDGTQPDGNGNNNGNDQPNGNDGEITFPTYSGKEGAQKIEELGKAAGLDSNWIRFFLMTARGESAFTSNVVLGDRSIYPPGSKASPNTDRIGPGEAAGARTAYNRGVAQGRYVDCPWPATAYTYGSAGWFAMLVANAWAAYNKTELRCRHPWYLLHPVDQIITAIEFARGLTGWSAFRANPTWLTLRVGWGNPSKMDDPERHAHIRNKVAPHLDALGIPRSWLDQKVTKLPKGDIVARWESLMAASGMAPGKKGA